jgi:predicted ATPase
MEIIKFRKLIDLKFKLGSKITVIAGHNGTLKSTLLGLIGHPFSMLSSSNEMKNAKTIDGYSFQSKFSDKFNFSLDYEKSNDYRFNLYFCNNSIYPGGIYQAKCIFRKVNNIPQEIRIWSVRGREKGMGYVQIPVIFLSLKRLIPVGEEKIISNKLATLDSDEVKLFIKYHRNILLINDKIDNIEQFKSSNKSSLGVKTSLYDSLTNSSGQDNLGKLLLSIFSFKRLQDKYKALYKGGILLVDELDATLFPRAQEKLVESLYHFAAQYSIQFIFTTHSPSILRICSQNKYSGSTSLIYLKNDYQSSQKITLYENPPFELLEADLNFTVAKMSANRPSDKKLRSIVKIKLHI